MARYWSSVSCVFMYRERKKRRKRKSPDFIHLDRTSAANKWVFRRNPAVWLFKRNPFGSFFHMILFGFQHFTRWHLGICGNFLRKLLPKRHQIQFAFTSKLILQNKTERVLSRAAPWEFVEAHCGYVCLTMNMFPWCRVCRHRSMDGRSILSLRRSC